jgi:glycosyltransferase involved in cell wall biosynthesis
MLTVSIITVVRNEAATIRDCIESVIGQSHPAEYLVIDGASTDGTMAIVNEYATRIRKIVSEPDRGIYDAMNKGLSLATGDVIGILNADDFYRDRNVLERVVRAIENNYVDSCYGDLVCVDPANTQRVVRYWKAGHYHRNRFYHGWMPPHPTFFVRRSVYEHHGNFDLSLGTAADYELTLRFLLKHRISTYYIPEVITIMRMGGVSNATFKARLQTAQMVKRSWDVNGIKVNPLTLVLRPLYNATQYLWRYRVKLDR